MAYEIRFFRGTSEAYLALESRNDRTFYFTTDDHQLYIGNFKITNSQEISEALERIEADEERITRLENLLQEIFGDDPSLDSIVRIVEDVIKELDSEVNAQKSSSDPNAVAVISGVTQRDGLLFSVSSADVDAAGAATTALSSAKDYSNNLFNQVPVAVPLTNREIEEILNS